jgi:hypothetical protein
MRGRYIAASSHSVRQCQTWARSVQLGFADVLTQTDLLRLGSQAGDVVMNVSGDR